MHLMNHHSPIITSTLDQIQDEEAGYILVRKPETRDFTFIRKDDPDKKRRKYSWDENASDGIPIDLQVKNRTMHVWLDNDEVAFNPQLFKEIQENIQNAIDNILSWDYKSIKDLKNSIKSFLEIADGRIFTTYKGAPFDFLTPWSFIFYINLPSMEHYYLSNSNPTLGNRLDAKYGTYGFDYKFCSDLDTNILILQPTGTMLSINSNLSLINDTEGTKNSKLINNSTNNLIKKPAMTTLTSFI